MCVLQVTLAYESIVLYMCEGKVLMDTNLIGIERHQWSSIVGNDSVVLKNKISCLPKYISG